MTELKSYKPILTVTSLLDNNGYRYIGDITNRNEKLKQQKQQKL